MKKFKNIFLGFLFITLLFVQQNHCYAVNTSKIINTNANAQSKNCWVDTSKWELRWHSETRHRWERKVIPLPRPGNMGGYRVWIPDHNAWPTGNPIRGYWANAYEKSHYIVAKLVPYTYRWQQYDWIPSGFIVEASSYTAVIDKKQRFIYTEWHKKEDNSPACLDLDIKLSNVKLNGKPAKIKELSIYHKVARFNGKTDTVKPYSVSYTEENTRFKGKLKYPHAGSEKSELHIIVQTEAIFPISVGKSGKSNNYIYNKKVIVPIDIKLNIPVNGYYVINTGSTKNLDKGLEFLGTENHFVIKN